MSHFGTPESREVGVLHRETLFSKRDSGGNASISSLAVTKILIKASKSADFPPKNILPSGHVAHVSTSHELVNSGKP